MLCFNALKTATRTCILSIPEPDTCHLGQTEILSPDETYDYVNRSFEEQNGITWLEPMGFTTPIFFRHR
jgi:hypothetical protein